MLILHIGLPLASKDRREKQGYKVCEGLPELMARMAHKESKVPVETKGIKVFKVQKGTLESKVPKGRKVLALNTSGRAGRSPFRTQMELGALLWISQDRREFKDRKDQQDHKASPVPWVRKDQQALKVP